MRNSLWMIFLLLPCASYGQTPATPGQVTLVCSSPDPNLGAPTLVLDESQSTITFTWNERVLPGGATKPPRESGTYQATFTAQEVAFDIIKGDRDDHYTLSRRNGTLVQGRYKTHKDGASPTLEEEKSWDCQKGAKALF
jgi:hypothetical protein